MKINVGAIIWKVAQLSVKIANMGHEIRGRLDGGFLLYSKSYLYM
jgi:hypothetical protein